MVKIRLSQTGSRNRKTYRIVAIDEQTKRDGKAIEILGFYNPLVTPPQLEVKMDRVKYWISVGAQPTEAIRTLLKLS